MWAGNDSTISGVLDSKEDSFINVQQETGPCQHPGGKQ